MAALKPWGVSILALALSLIAAGYGWTLFQRSSPAEPSRPETPSGIFILLDGPADTALIDAEFDPDGRYRIGVRAPAGTKASNFLVIATGGSCAKSLYAGPVREFAFRLGETRYVYTQYGLRPEGDVPHSGLSAGRNHSVVGLEGPVIPACGSVGRVNTGVTYFNAAPPVVVGQLTSSLTNVAGEFESGTLPVLNALGSGERYDLYVIESMRFTGAEVRLSGTYDADVRAAKAWHFPRRADVNASVNYGVYDGASSYGHWEDKTELPRALPLPNGLLLSSAEPSTEASGAIAWHWDTARAATWTILDRAAQERLSNYLFFSGILLGAALSFLALALEKALERLMASEKSGSIVP
jgi:hypothetical protein